MRAFLVLCGLDISACQTPLTPIDACEPKTCVEAGAACGALDDGCGGVLDCGSCLDGGGGGGSAGGAAGGGVGGSSGGAAGGSAGGFRADAGTRCPAPNSSGPSSSYTFAQWPVAVAPFQPSNYRVGTCGPGTALDVTTGLVWQQVQSDSKLTQDQAVSFCEGLVLGGQSDWRLPTRVELTSIQDETRYPWPSLVTSVFIGVPDAGASSIGPDLWSSTQDLFFSAREPYFYVVTFVGGAVSSIHASTSLHFVRCVRSGPALSVTTRYTLGLDPDGTPTALDVVTGLTWKRIPERGPLMFSQAVAACVAPWRLPSIRELHTLQDPTLATPPQVNQAAFSAVSGDVWSSSVNPQGGGYSMGFSNAAGAFGAAHTFGFSALCVR